MNAAPLAWVLCLVVPTLLGGCASDPEPAPAAATTVAARAANSGILLRVLVITDEYLPVTNARVILVGLGVNGTTDQWGDAFFHLAKPGRYALHVHRHGFYPNQTRVVVEEGESRATARVRLLDAPHDTDYSDFYYFTGLCGPTLYVRGTADNSECTDTRFVKKPEARFILGRGLVQGYLALSWNDHPAGAAAMRMEVRFPEIGAFANGTEVLVAEGPSPVRMLIPSELLTPKHRENGHTIVINVGLSRAQPISLNIEQEFSIDGEFDYHNPAPDVDPET